jgi:hypothetical protein
MRRRRAMGMGVGVMVMARVVGVVVRHGKMLHYNITGVHVVARPWCSRAPHPVILREGGVSSTPRILVQSLLSLGYWVTRLRG